MTKQLNPKKIKSPNLPMWSIDFDRLVNAIRDGLGMSRIGITLGFLVSLADHARDSVDDIEFEARVRVGLQRWTRQREAERKEAKGVTHVS